MSTCSPSQKAASVSGKCVQLRVPAETEYLELIRQVVHGVALRMGFGPQEAAEVEMSVDEACTNVIVHAYGRPPGQKLAPGAPDDAIDLQIVFCPEKIAILILDRAKPFTPEDLGELEIKEHLAQRKGHGLGIYIIKRFMHEVKYTYKPGRGNELQLVRYLKTPHTSCAEVRS